MKSRSNFLEPKEQKAWQYSDGARASKHSLHAWLLPARVRADGSIESAALRIVSINALTEIGDMDIGKIYRPTTGADDWQQFLADPEKQWRRGYSAMAAALSWECANGLPQEIAELIGGSPELLLAIPEHKVALPGGSRDSQCDVFALVKASEDTIAVSIEAKVNEPFGPTVGEWLKDASTGKIERLRFICELLGLDKSPPDGLRYQLFHRTAAAILEAQRFKTDGAAMIVQSFSQENRWFEDFEAFAHLFGLEVEPGRSARIELPSGKPLFLGWAVGSAEYL